MQAAAVVGGSSNSSMRESSTGNEIGNNPSSFIGNFAPLPKLEERKVPSDQSSTSECTKPLDITARRQKHNEVEVRRRKKIKQKFDQLASVIGCTNQQKRVIIAKAIRKLNEYECTLHSLKQRVDEVGESEGSSQFTSKAETVSPTPKYDIGLSHHAAFLDSAVPQFVASFDGKIVDCNAAFAQLFFKTRESFLNPPVTIFSIASPDTLVHFFQLVSSLMRGNPSVYDVISIVTGKQILQTHITAWTVTDVMKKPRYFMGLLIPMA